MHATLQTWPLNTRSEESLCATSRMLLRQVRKFHERNLVSPFLNGQPMQPSKPARREAPAEGFQNHKSCLSQWRRSSMAFLTPSKAGLVKSTHLRQHACLGRAIG